MRESDEDTKKSGIGQQKLKLTDKSASNSSGANKTQGS